MTNKDSPNFIRISAGQMPFWQILYNSLTEDLKQEKYIKHVYRHTIKEINDVIYSGKLWCDDCGKEIELKLPKNYEELVVFVLRFINSNCIYPCNDCLLKSAENGHILGSEKLGWYPNKEDLLKEIKGKE